MAKELYSRGMSTLDISEKIGMGESTVRKIVEENKS
jgi:transposase